MPRKTEITSPGAGASGPAKPESFQSVIRDRQGCPFVLHGCLGPRDWEFDIATLDGDFVGELRMRIGSGTAQIDHLHICTRGPATAPRWIRNLMRSLRLPPRTIHFRNRGLGSLLVVHAINAARTHRLNDVIAWIPAGAAYLGWFHKQGFSSHVLDGGIVVWHETGTPGFIYEDPTQRRPDPAPADLGAC